MLQRKSREQTGLSIVPRDEQPPEQKGPSPTTPAVEPTERKAQPESQAAPPRDTKSARGLKAYRKPLMAGAGHGLSRRAARQTPERGISARLTWIGIWR